MISRILPSGHEVILDEDDFKRLSEYKYYIHKKGYAYRFYKSDGKQKVSYLHVDVMGGTKEGLVIDHINRNKLDNRKENLRYVTNRTNLHNSKKNKGSYSSIYKGVSWNPKSKGWSANVRDKKNISLGLFETEAAAANAYNEYVKCNRDEYAHINDVPFDADWESKRIKNRREGTGKSSYVGVSWSKAMGKWQSHIMVNYKSIGLGCFDSEIEAANAYNQASIKYRGEKAKLNII